MTDTKFKNKNIMENYFIIQPEKKSKKYIGWSKEIGIYLVTKLSLSKKFEDKLNSLLTDDTIINFITKAIGDDFETKQVDGYFLWIK